MADFIEKHINAAEAAIVAGDIRDLSSEEAAEYAGEVYKQWLRETGFVDTAEIRLAFTAGWVAGGVATTEKMTATYLKQIGVLK